MWKGWKRSVWDTREGPSQEVAAGQIPAEDVHTDHK